MYTPLPSCLTIGPSAIHGLGIFAVEDIPDQTILGVSHWRKEGQPQGYARTPLGGFINHSTNPNCIKLSTEECSLTIKATRDIEMGEEITVTYSLYHVDEWAEVIHR